MTTITAIAISIATITTAFSALTALAGRKKAERPSSGFHSGDYIPGNGWAIIDGEFIER